MTFSESVKTVFGKYATFRGRAARSEYWWWALLNIIITTVLYVPYTYAVLAQDTTMLLTTGLLMAAWGLGVLIPNLAVTVRRLHDTNRSGWNILWSLIPLVGGIVVFVFLVLEGTHGDNSYGTDPLNDSDGGQDDTVF